MTATRSDRLRKEEGEVRAMARNSEVRKSRAWWDSAGRFLARDMGDSPGGGTEATPIRLEFYM